MALLNTCLADILISPHSENDGLENFLDELLRSSSLLTATKAGANCTQRLNNMDDSDSEATEQNLNALLPSSDSESNWSAYESDQDNVHLNSDWDVTDDILSDLGLLPETDILENALIESHIPTFFDEEEPPKTKSQDVVHDHDYFAQKSPSATSDSGISSNGAYSPHSMSEDHLQHSPRESSLSGSPRSQSNLDIQINSANENLGDTTPITLENFDFKNFDMSTIDAGAFLGDTDFLSLSDGTQDSDVTINVMDTDLMEDTVTSSSQTPTGSSTKMTKIIKVCTTKNDTLPFTMKDVSCVTSSSKFPELLLTDEERELLYKEGVTLPTNMPLTKEEERVLKAVRRKIRNKASAKESRKRKMTYVEGLEKRVKLSTTENNQLKKKVDTLEKQNSQLIQQLKKLQALVLSKTKPQASTCLVVLIMSFAFLIVPNIDPFGIKKDKLSDPKSIPIPGKSRSLLHSPDEMQDIDTDPYGLTIKPGPPWEVPPKTPVIPLPPNVVIETVDEEAVSKLVENTENTGPLNTSIDNVTSQRAKVNQDTQEFTKTQTHQHRQDL